MSSMMRLDLRASRARFSVSLASSLLAVSASVACGFRQMMLAVSVSALMSLMVSWSVMVTGFCLFSRECDPARVCVGSSGGWWG